MTYTSSAPLIASVEGTTPGSQKIKIRAAGTVTITASQAGDSAYDPAPDANQTFVVGYYNLFSDSIPGLKLWLDGNSVDSDHSAADTIADGTEIGSWKDRSVPITQRRVLLLTDPHTKQMDLTVKVFSFTRCPDFDITSDSTIRTIFAVLKQASSQTAETQPFGGNISATTTGAKFGLKRTGSSMMDSGISSHSLAVVTLQMASVVTQCMNGEERVTGTIQMLQPYLPR